jgi:hypothetical protein
MSHDYNFAAADRLEKGLNQLIAKLDWLIWLRTTQRNALLGASRSDNWRGAKRDESDRTYTRQQSALNELKDRARSLQRDVAAATAAAHKAQKPGSGGNTRTPWPGTSPASH